MSRKPPPNWEELIKRLTLFRKSNKAPVDSMGMEAISEHSIKHLKRQSKRRKLLQSEREVSEFHALVGLMLSSQTNDKITSVAVKDLIADNGLTPQSIISLPEERLKAIIGKVSFFNRKTEYLKKVSKIIIENHHGRVPSTFKELTMLPGVGNKMAHLFLQICHNLVEGISVDVHLFRIAHRWKWVDASCNTPDKTANGLQEWLPKEHWKEINPLVVGFGQILCEARNPKCKICPLADLCPSARLSEI